jgi:hypothetical protein
MLAAIASMRPSRMKYCVRASVAASPRAPGGVQARGHVGAQFEQFGEAQQHQRHGVVAVQVGVEDQVRLVADARDQRAPLFQRHARGGTPFGRTGLRGRCQRVAELAAERGALHAVAVLLLEARQRLRRRGAGALPAGRGQQRFAHAVDVGRARHLLAAEVDRDELLVDENAADEDNGAQVQQVDDQQLAAYAEPAEATGNEVHHIPPGSAACMQSLGLVRANRDRSFGTAGSGGAKTRLALVGARVWVRACVACVRYQA